VRGERGREEDRLKMSSDVPSASLSSTEAEGAYARHDDGRSRFYMKWCNRRNLERDEEAVTGRRREGGRREEGARDIKERERSVFDLLQAT